MSRASSLLKELEQIRDRFGPGDGDHKLALIEALRDLRFERPAELLRFHDVLCYLQAYPDDSAVLAAVEELLQSFASRADLRRHRSALADSGIAGTPLHYSFYWTTARWLARSCPERLHLDWTAFEKKGKLEDFLHLLLPYGETLAIDEAQKNARRWVNLLKGPEETDAAFVIERFDTLQGDAFVRETIYEDLAIPLRVDGGPGTPHRSGIRLRGAPVAFQAAPLDRARPDLRRRVRKPPQAVRALTPRQGAELIELARNAMVVRSRDLYAFQYADHRDVRLVDFGDGLHFAAIGIRPERRLLLDTVYAFLTLKNGVPIGYVLSSAFFNSAEVAYNVFETWRGGESARIYGCALAMVRHLFGAEVYTVPPYQIGKNNDEALRSGAWWFYYKLGFRPLDPAVLKLVEAELRRMRRDPRHRSSMATLRKLVAKDLFYFPRRPRRDVRGLVSIGNIGVRVSRYLAERFGAAREAGLATCADEAARLLGLRSRKAWSADERRAWEWWAPLILILPGLERWDAAQRRALVQVVRAKGGRRESDYVLLLDSHRPLRRALLKLARDDPDS